MVLECHQNLAVRVVYKICVFILELRIAQGSVRNGNLAFVVNRALVAIVGEKIRQGGVRTHAQVHPVRRIQQNFFVGDAHQFAGIFAEFLFV